jgi:hypothetical protein
MNISLDGLLDYEEEDREESTFEVSRSPCPVSAFASLFLSLRTSLSGQHISLAGVVFL